MKKYLGLLVLPLMLIASNALPAFALADTISTGVQTQGGTLTGATINVNGGDYYCNVNITINGTPIYQSGNQACADNPETFNFSGSIPFNSGDDIEIVPQEFGGGYYDTISSYSLEGTISSGGGGGGGGGGSSSTTNCNTSSTLLNASGTGSMIGCINTTWYSYFLVLLEKYWPFVVGVALLLMVWVFGKRAITDFQ